ncbi:MAG: OsmC family protein [Alicyclobacillus sp.]|nr:OsmC family protein [Alicyclobacillus sp.]
MEMQVTTTWHGKRQFVSQGASGHQVVIDAKEEAGGENRGSRPMELLLMGLTGCTGIDIAMILERMREPLQGLRIEATGVRQEAYPQKFVEIHLTYHIEGAVQPAKAWRAIHLSEEKYCSASASFNARIVPHLVLNGEPVPDAASHSVETEA